MTKTGGCPVLDTVGPVWVQMGPMQCQVCGTSVKTYLISGKKCQMERGGENKKSEKEQGDTKVRAEGGTPWCCSRYPLELMERPILEQMGVPKGTVARGEPAQEQRKCVRGK